MLFVGLTGGIGSGKSEALAAFERAGVPALSSDTVVHDLLSSPEIRELVAERWGPDVLDSQGLIRREAVAEIVFERPDELSWLEGVLFPRVGERTQAWRSELEQRESPPAIAIVEVPLLFEAGVESAFDETIAVVAPEPLREERAGARGHRAVGGRSARQLSQKEKARRADHVIENDGTLSDLESRVRDLLSDLTKKTAGAA